MSDDCPNTEALCEFVEGRIGEMDRERFEQHLDGCPSCRRAIVEVGRALGAETPVSVTTDRPSATRSTAPPSHRLSRYEIRREVAAGGMGVVYEGWDPSLSRRVALKLMRPDLKAAATTEQLAEEARALAKVSHPNVLTVFDVGIEGDNVFLAAEYVEGVTMDKGWPHRARSYRDRIDAYLQAARGLAAIHGAGLLHRDIKPTNILLGNDGRVRITDFGLAVGENQRAIPAGTPAYMAPEQRTGAPGPAADQFALAVCLTEALLSERVKPGTTADELAKKARGVWGESPPPREVWRALETALSEDAAKRHTSVEAFARALEDALADVPRGKRGSRRVVAAGLVVAAAGIAAVVFAQSRKQPGPEGAIAAPAETAPAAVSGSVANEGPPTDSAAPDASGEVAPPWEIVVPVLPAPGAGSSPSPTSADARGATPVPALPEGGPVDVLKKNTEYYALIDEASKAMTAKDGKKCLDRMAKARAIHPTLVDSLSTMRAACEMMVGKCNEGAARLKGDPNLGAAGSQLADTYKATYCPVDTKQSSPAERLKAVGFQAASPPFTAAKCEQYVAQADKAIKDHGDTKPDTTALAMARNNTAMCFAWVGDCARTAKMIGGMVPAGEDRDERVKKAVRQAHPNCANFGQ